MSVGALGKSTGCEQRELQGEADRPPAEGDPQAATCAGGDRLGRIPGGPHSQAGLARDGRYRYDERTNSECSPSETKSAGIGPMLRTRQGGGTPVSHRRLRSKMPSCANTPPIDRRTPQEVGVSNDKRRTVRAPIALALIMSAVLCGRVVPMGSAPICMNGYEVGAQQYGHEPPLAHPVGVRHGRTAAPRALALCFSRRERGHGSGEPTIAFRERWEGGSRKAPQLGGLPLGLATQALRRAPLGGRPAA